ncbi:MAG: IgGFc-binding protein [Dokdonella sp.]
MGCDFYAVTLPNPLAAQQEITNSAEYDYAVGVQNLSPGIATSISISGGALTSPQIVQLTAGASQTVVLPKVDTLWQSPGTKVVIGGAYHIVASNPILTLQYNTINPVSGSNDASLLVPIESAGTSFRVLVWPTADLAGGSLYPGQLGIVATRSGTTVQIQASSAVFQVGAGLTATGGSITLNAGDVLLLASAATTGADSSGTLITSNAPILVWSSHSGAQVPAGTGYADYLETLLPPIAALGNDYFVARPANPPGSTTGAQQYVKLVGTVNGTNLVFDPSITGAPATLQAGSAYTFPTTKDFHLQSDHPIVVAQFMEGGSVYGVANTDGDPSETITVPTAQARTSVTFYAPQIFTPNYAQVIAPTGAAVTVDGAAVTGWTSIGSSGYAVANYLLCCTDAHQATGDHPFLMSVYSYPPGFTSYWYPAALGIADDIFADGFD